MAMKLVVLVAADASMDAKFFMSHNIDRADHFLLS